MAFLPMFQLIFFVEIIRSTINFRSFLECSKFHEDYSLVLCLVINYKYTKNNPLLWLWERIS